MLHISVHTERMGWEEKQKKKRTNECNRAKCHNIISNVYVLMFVCNCVRVFVHVIVFSVWASPGHQHKVVHFIGISISRIPSSYLVALMLYLFLSKRHDMLYYTLYSLERDRKERIIPYMCIYYIRI